MTGAQTGAGSQAWWPAYVCLDVHDPLIAWLVYRAELVSAPHIHERALSVWATKRLRNGQAYQRELLLEEARGAHFPNAVSRLTGFYAFPDQESALAAAKRWNGPLFREEMLAEVVIDPSSRVSKYDAEWITHHFGSPDSRWMHDYFAGAPTADPIWECLIDGRAIVLEKSSREAAYETVKATWPGSLAMLELARVAVELDSDLGLITAMLFDASNSLGVRYELNFVDAKNPDFLKRFGEFQGPKNTNDLTPESKLVPPDLTSRGFMLS
jgi:hypothetical protein